MAKTDDRNLTSDDLITQRLKEACDVTYYDGLYRDQLYAFGDKPGRMPAHGDGSPNEHPNYGATMITRLRAGKSKRLMNAAFVHLSKICSGTVEPWFSQVDRWTGEVRKQAYIERTRGNFYGLEGLNEETAAMFLDGDQLGVGFTHWIFKRSRESGQYYVCGHNSPALNTLWDIHARHPGRARYWAPVLYIPEDEALRRWGDKVKDEIETYFDEGTNTGRRALKVYWYEDIGDDDGGEPTLAIIQKTFDGERLEKRRNVTGRLNMSYYVHFCLPGATRPWGRIVMSSATQEMLNRMEERMLRVMKRPDLDVLDLSGVDKQQFNAYLRGERDWVESSGIDPDKAVQRVPGARLHPDFAQMRDWYEGQFRADSGTSDYDVGNKPAGDVTKFEASLIDTRSQVTNIWSRRQYQASQIRGVDSCLRNMAIGDRDPLMLDIFGYNVLINNPEDPRSWFDQFMSEPSQIRLDEDALDTQARDQKQALRIARLKELQPLIPLGLVNPIWWAEEMVKAAANLQDPAEAMMPGLTGSTAGDTETGAPVTPGLLMGGTDETGQPVAAAPMR